MASCKMISGGASDPFGLFDPGLPAGCLLYWFKAHCMSSLKGLGVPPGEVFQAFEGCGLQAIGRVA